MSGAHAEDIQKHVRIYLVVFASLGVLTVVTVAASYIHVSVALSVTLALLIASIKGSLVACYFMHLISERRLVYGVLALTAVFFAVMMALIMSSFGDQQGESAPGAVPAPAPVEAHHVS